MKNLKQIVSLKWRIDGIIQSFNSQFFNNGQRYLTSKQLTQLKNIEETLEIGRAYPCCHSQWSVHNMVQINNYLKAQILSLKLGCMYD
jgi:hypothetical protein